MQIGNTPLIRLEKVTPGNGVEIWVKWEGANPTGSMKDRMALSMVQGASRPRAGCSRAAGVVEFTGGSTGSSLAMVCAALGFRAHFVSSDAFAEEKLQTMRAFGAALEIVPSVNGKVTPDLFQTGLRPRARTRRRAQHVLDPAVRQPRQPRAAITPMADETLATLGGRLDEFVMMVGTAAASPATPRSSRRSVPGVRCIAGEPADQPRAVGAGPHRRAPHRRHRRRLRARQLPRRSGRRGASP